MPTLDPAALKPRHDMPVLTISPVNWQGVQWAILLTAILVYFANRIEK